MALAMFSNDFHHADLETQQSPSTDPQTIQMLRVRDRLLALCSYYKTDQVLFTQTR